MTLIEKFGLIFIILFFTKSFPESSKGEEIGILLLGIILFIAGKYIQEFLTAVFEVK